MDLAREREADAQVFYSPASSRVLEKARIRNVEEGFSRGRSDASAVSPVSIKHCLMHAFETHYRVDVFGKQATFHGARFH